MKIVIAMDSFKGSLTSLEAGNAVKEAVLEVNKEIEVSVRPIADGGEGTVEALAMGMGGELVETKVTGPLGEPVTATYCLLTDRHTAVIEMASAAGITLVPLEKRNPYATTTYGVGELILDAISKGCRRFIIGIGGSATNDGGVGMLQAFGYEFLDEAGVNIGLGGDSLERLANISTDKVIPELKDCTFQIACDVTNPLCGENGCSAVYGPQKGATPEMVKQMDTWLMNYAHVTEQVSEKANKNYPGAGAAGGLGFAFLTFTNAVLESGIQIILEETSLEHYIKDADLVITGEGRLDGQTAMGKAPIGVARLAKKYGKKVIAFSGCATDDAVICNEYGIDAFFTILRNVVSLEEALVPENAAKNLKATAIQVFRLVTSIRNVDNFDK